MAGDVYSANGAKLFIGPSVTPTTDTVAEFAALTWTEVGNVQSLGEYGDEAQDIPFTALGDGRTRHAKGSRDASVISVVVGRDGTDTGQIALSAAEATNNNFGFKIVLPNRLTSGGTDEINYFRANVRSKRKNVGSANNVIMDTYNVGISSPVYEVAAT